MIQAQDIESAVLGLAIQHEKCRATVLSELSEEDFTDNRRKLFRTIRDLYEQDDAVSRPMVLEEFEDKGLVDHVISEAKEVNPKGVQKACDYLKPYRKGRDFKQLCHQYYQQAESNIHNINEFLSEAGTEFFRLLSDGSDERIHHSGDSIEDDAANIIAPEEDEDRIYTHTDLDKIVKGYRPGQLVILGGKTGHGKSVFMQNLIYRSALGGLYGAVWSGEMTRREINERIISMDSGVDYTDIVNKEFTESQKKKISQSAERIKESVGYTIIDEYTTLNGLYAMARRLKMERDIKYFVIDYLQQLRSDANTREQEVANVMRTGKQIATDLEIVVFGLSQFNRDVDGRPHLNQFKYSGSIENWANVAVILWNPSADGLTRFPDTKDEGKWSRMETEGIVELHVAKNRSGRTGTVKLGFDGSVQRFHKLPEHKRP